MHKETESEIRKPMRAVVRAPHHHLLVRALGRMKDAIIAVYWRSRFGMFGARSTLHAPLKITGHRQIRVGNDVRIWRDSRIEALTTNLGKGLVLIGDGTIIQPDVHIASASTVRIGDNVLIASQVYISDHDHDIAVIEDPVRRNSGVVVADVSIGSGTWLGEKVVITKGVHIGANCVIGASSVVTRSIPDFTMAVGVPARPIKSFDPSRKEWFAL